MLKGQIKEQDIVDIGAIGLALLLRKNTGIKKRNARGRLRVRTAGVLGLTQADGKRGA